MTYKKACLVLLMALVLAPATPVSDSHAANPKPMPPPAARSPQIIARGGTADITPAARQVERLAGELVVKKKLPGLALAIVQGGKVIVLRGYGVTSAGSKDPVTADTVFRLASLSKAFL